MSAPVNPLANTNTSSTTQPSSTSPNDSNTQHNTTQNENNTPINQTSTNEPSQQSNTNNDTNNTQSTNHNSNSEQKAPENENNPPPKPQPKKRCPHANHIKKRVNKFKSVACEKCKRNSGADDKLVFCLSCSKLNCSRTSEHTHGLNHWVGSNQKHNLCMMIPTFQEYSENTKDTIIDDMLQIWCYKCNVFLDETGQDNTDKIRRIKSEVYGCLVRGYKKLSHKHKQKYKQQNNSYNYNTVSVTPHIGGSGKNKKKKDRYAQYKNQYTNNQQRRGNNNVNVNVKSIEEWSVLDNDFITTMSNDESNGYIGIFGLNNLGNTCFFNSILQNLSETRPLIKALTDSSDIIKHTAKKIQDKDAKDAVMGQHGNNKNKNKNSPRGRRNAYGKKQQQQAAMDKKLRGRLLTEFHHVIHDAYNSVGKRGSVVPSGLLNAVIARNRRFAGRRQQDSHELMRVLVEGMRDQNEKMLKKDRKIKVSRNLNNWTPLDILQWTKCYDIELKCITMEPEINVTNEIKLDITIKDFKEFIKVTNDEAFFNKVGLNEKDENDSKSISNFKRGRICLINEECEYYCNKHGYAMPKYMIEHKNKDNDSKVHDIENKPKHKINTIIDDVFGGCIQSCVTCYGCGNVSRTTEEFFDLSLPISNPKSNAFGGRYGGGGNAWFTQKKSKKQKKKEKQQRWAAQNKKNKQQQNSKKNNKKNNKGNKHQNKQKKVENEENIELADNVAVSINIKKAYDDKNKDKDTTDNNAKVNDKKQDENDGKTKTENKEEENQKIENKDENIVNDASNDASTNVSSVTISPTKSVREVSMDSPNKSETKTEKEETKKDDKEEKKEKYVPTPLPSIRGMDRLKGDTNLLDCLAAFTDPELLTDSDKYGCKYCTRIVLEKIKNENKEKWDDIIKKYLLFTDKINALKQKQKGKKQDNENKNENGNSDENEEENNSAMEDENENENENENEEEDNEDEDDDSDNENKMEIEEVGLDEIDRMMNSGYPLKRHNAKKQILIHKPPQVLALHLKRFEQQGYRLSKVGKRVRFPLHLNITPYLTDECKIEHTYKKKIINGNDTIKEEVKDEIKCMYQLYGISVHHGSMGGGHYIAYTHKHRDNGPKQGWYYFSDSSYRGVPYQDAMKAEAYVLFYQKCENNIIINNQEAKSNDSDDNDIQ